MAKSSPRKHNPPQTSRGLAMACLTEWTGTGKPIQGFINTIIHDSGLKTADRQLAVMLVMGVLRRQQYLDTIISRFAKTPMRKMKPLTLVGLRIGVFQILFLERVPDSAAVNETIKALKKFRQPGWLIKFVNGTLRTIVREKQVLPEPAIAGPNKSPIFDHPSWMTDQWQNNFGQQRMEEICRVNNLEPRLCLQVNTPRIAINKLIELFVETGLVARPGRYAPDSLILPEHRGAITGLPGFDRGFFQVQDQAAQLSCMLLPPLKNGARYLDGCAGLGGKTCSIARLLPVSVEATLTAVEPDKRRIRLLKENLDRQNLSDHVSILNQDLQTFAATNPQPFDAILIDAPCSGTGVIRNHPDIRWNRQPDDFPSYRATQLSLLETAALLLAPGGRLIYATCSLEPEENEQVIEQFLSTSKTFHTLDCRDLLPDSAGQLVNDNGFFNPLPSEGIEGFFAAVLERKETIEYSVDKSAMRGK